MAAIDDFASYSHGLNTRLEHSVSVSPSDSTDLTHVSRGIWVGTSGDLAFITVGGDTDTWPSVPAGSLLPIAATRILSTGTTASNIHAGW